jgi:adenine phosphoribosyltransferase
MQTMAASDGAAGEGRSGEDARIEGLRRLIRDVPDFPKPGIVFKDWMPMLGDSQALHDAVALLAEPFANERIDHVIGVEARGFLLGIPVAMQLGAGFVPVRKQGKLPHETFDITYDLEYGTDTLEMHVDAVLEGERVLLIDDLLATGGTAAAAVELVRKARADIAGCAFLIELDFLHGAKKLGVDRVRSLIHY